MFCCRSSNKPINRERFECKPCGHISVDFEENSGCRRGVAAKSKRCSWILVAACWERNQEPGRWIEGWLERINGDGSPIKSDACCSQSELVGLRCWFWLGPKEWLDNSSALELQSKKNQIKPTSIGQKIPNKYKKAPKKLQIYKLSRVWRSSNFHPHKFVDPNKIWGSGCRCRAASVSSDVDVIWLPASSVGSDLDFVRCDQFLSSGSTDLIRIVSVNWWVVAAREITAGPVLMMMMNEQNAREIAAREITETGVRSPGESPGLELDC